MKKRIIKLCSLVLSILILQIVCFATNDEGTTFIIESCSLIVSCKAYNL